MTTFDKIKYHWLEALLFCVAIGNADVWRDYLIGTGGKDSWQLLIAIYATELVIVSAGLWGKTGLYIASAMFAISLVAIKKKYGIEGDWFGGDWIGHSYFSCTIWLGTIGNYYRRQQALFANRKALGAAGEVIGVSEQGAIDTKSIAKLSVQKIMKNFGLNNYRATKLQKMARQGHPITIETITAMQN